MLNKDLSELKIQDYFKKIGKRNFIRLFSLLLLILVVGIFSFQAFQKGQAEKNELSQILNDKEMEELQLLKSKKEQDELYLLLKEYADSITEEDVHEHTLESLRFFEQLALKYSLNIYLHNVNDLEYIVNNDETEQHYVHIALGLEGDFESIMKFIEEVKQSELPVLLKNTQFIIDDEAYPEDHEFEIIKSQLDFYVFEERIFIEKADGVYFDEKGILKLLETKSLLNGDEEKDTEHKDDFLIIGDDTDVFEKEKNEDDFAVSGLPSISPFGMYSFEIEEEESDTYDEYQSFLEQYLNSISGDSNKDEKDEEGEKVGQNKGTKSNSSDSISKKQNTEKTTNTGGLSRYFE